MGLTEWQCGSGKDMSCEQSVKLSSQCRWTRLTSVCRPNEWVDIVIWRLASGIRLTLAASDNGQTQP